MPEYIKTTTYFNSKRVLLVWQPIRLIDSINKTTTAITIIVLQLTMSRSLEINSGWLTPTWNWGRKPANAFAMNTCNIHDQQQLNTTKTGKIIEIRPRPVKIRRKSTQIKSFIATKWIITSKGIQWGYNFGWQREPYSRDKTSDEWGNPINNYILNCEQRSQLVNILNNK